VRSRFRLFNRFRYKHTLSSLLKHHSKGSSGADDIYNDVDMIRCWFSWDDGRGGEEDVQAQVIYPVSIWFHPLSGAEKPIRVW
jgi:hypothetical protein